MPCYHFTYHAYRTWRPDHPRGFVKRHQGVQPPDPDLADRYDRLATHPPVRFDRPHQQALLWIIHDACSRRDWRLHQVATDPTHVHILVSWREVVSWNEVSRILKNLASRELTRRLGPRHPKRDSRQRKPAVSTRPSPSPKWFVRHASRKRVRDRKHFDYLMMDYLPRHPGLRWCEGDAPPSEPSGPPEPPEPPASAGG